MKKRLNKKGFTLVEIVVVVSIIAILATIGIVFVAGKVAKAKEDATIATIHMIESAYKTVISEVDVDIALDRLWIYKNTPEGPLDLEIYNQISNIIGQEYGDKFCIVAHMDTGDEYQGLFHLYYTNNPPFSYNTEGYTYFDGEITKGIMQLPEGAHP